MSSKFHRQMILFPLNKLQNDIEHNFTQPRK